MFKVKFLYAYKINFLANKLLFILKLCSVLDGSDNDPLVMRRLDFEVPKSFPNPQKYIPKKIFDYMFEDVPLVVGSAISEAMSPDEPFDSTLTFVYFRNGRLPEFVVAYFMDFELPKRRLSDTTRFFRALHLITMFRMFMVMPDDHFLATDVDTGFGVGHVDTVCVEGEGRLGGEVGAGSSVPMERDVAEVQVKEEYVIPMESDDVDGDVSVLTAEECGDDDEEEGVHIIEEEREDDEENCGKSLLQVLDDLV